LGIKKFGLLIKVDFTEWFLPNSGSRYFLKGFIYYSRGVCENRLQEEFPDFWIFPRTPLRWSLQKVFKGPYCRFFTREKGSLFKFKGLGIGRTLLGFQGFPFLGKTLGQKGGP